MASLVAETPQLSPSLAAVNMRTHVNDVNGGVLAIRGDPLPEEDVVAVATHDRGEIEPVEVVAGPVGRDYRPGTQTVQKIQEGRLPTGLDHGWYRKTPPTIVFKK